ncbi:hypothetical protein HGRIS_009551 [Hohenbuehelia grisea]|uniref:RTA1-domain-containing protein n=1 Tax=Hohenbuehelia grisea TaxID=104357 RepID=A0ABR3J1P7_9AGAR
MPPSSAARSRILFPLLVTVFCCCLAQAQSPHFTIPADPFADPKHDPLNPLRYIASNALTAISFSLVLLVGLIESWLVYKDGGKYMLSLVIGCYTFALGLAFRFGLHVQPRSHGIYIAQYLFVVLSPCAFIASAYVLLGRLARYLDRPEYLAVSPQRITLVFVCSDITTFLVQATGGAISASADGGHMAEVGSRIFLGGIAAQLLSFVVFSIIYGIFLWRVYSRSQNLWYIDQHKAWYDDWRALAGALCICCVGILIRSVYRTVELGEGFLGHLATNEGFFYGLDTLPLFIAIAIFIPFWPGRFISSTPITQRSIEKP